MKNTFIFAFFFFAAILFGFFTSAEAATTIPYQTRPPLQEYLPVDSNGNIRTQTTYETKAVTSTGQHVTRYTTKPTLVSPSSLGKMAKGALVGPLGIGITAAIIAADYFIDPQTGDIVLSREGYTALGEIPQCSGASGVTIETAVSLCNQQLGSGWWGYPGKACTTTAGTRGIGFCANGGQNVYGWFRQSGPVYVSGQPLVSETGTATDSEVGDAIVSNDSNSQNKLIPNIIPESINSGRWRDEWPEAVSDSESINDTLENDIEGATNPTTDPTVTDSATVAPPPQSQSQTATEWPIFCDWASYVCDFIDWVKADPELPEDPEIPFVEIEPDDFNSGIGTGSCPADTLLQINSVGVSIPISWEHTCNLAETFRPILLLIAWIVSIYILIRSN